MAITLVTGPANAGKAQLVMDGVRRALAHGEEPLLVVPTRADVQHYLRELAGDGAAVGVRVQRFDGLIEEAVRRAEVSEPVLAGLARERMLEALLKRAGGSEATPGLVGALGELFAELQVRRVTPARLKVALASWIAADGPAPAPERLGALYSDYRSWLQRIGRLDGEQRAVRALDALRERPARWGRTPVLFYGFDDLTPLQLDAIETLGVLVGADVMVSLTFQPGRTAFAGRAAPFAALAPLAAEHLQLEPRAEYYAPHARAALAHLERSLFETGAGQMPAGAAVRLLEGGGERAELELIATDIRELIAGGMAPEEIAVLVRSQGTALDLVEEVLQAAEIPFALQRRRPFGDSAIGRALIGLLRCVPAPDGANAGELGDLLAWLRAPGLLERPLLADSLEIRARRAGALSAERARAMWEELHWPLERIERLAESQGRGPAALLEHAARELLWLFCAPRRAGAATLGEDELDEAGALAAGRRALAELRELAQIAPELAPIGAGELASLLERVEIFSGERPVRGAVAILDPLALRARRVRALFVCALQEGVFPARARPRPFLSEDERRRLAEVSGLRLGEPEDALAAERYLLYAALSRAQERLILSWHLADDDGDAKSRSLFVDDVCDLFDASLTEERGRRALGAIEAVSSGVLGAVSQQPSSRVLAGVGEPLRDEQLLQELREHVWSASSLERWIGCPTSWFVEKLLRPGAIDPNPEPLAKGGLAHAVLNDTLEGLRAQTGSARVSAATLGLARELLAGALTEREAEHPLSVSPERQLAVSRRLQVELERYLEHAAEAASPLEPSELELGFGFPEDEQRGDRGPLPAFDLGAGMRMRGRIDRVDVSADGEAVVYDYKSGRAVPGARWIKDDKLQVALYMAAVEQLLGLPVVGGFFQPLSGEDLRARGALDRESDTGLVCMKEDLRDPSELRELLAEALAGARRVADEASRGQLQARPESCAFKGGCMYPAICRCER
jgi:ATP-dependent helicase/DNAse subunit B